MIHGFKPLISDVRSQPLEPLAVVISSPCFMAEEGLFSKIGFFMQYEAFSIGYFTLIISSAVFIAAAISSGSGLPWSEVGASLSQATSTNRATVE